MIIAHNIIIKDPLNLVIAQRDQSPLIVILAQFKGLSVPATNGDSTDMSIYDDFNIDMGDHRDSLEVTIEIGRAHV